MLNLPSYKEKLSRIENALFIIGNGFDIFHGVKSKYKNFKEFLIFHQKNNLVDLLDCFFWADDGLWRDLECALGKYDEEYIFEECRPDEEIDLDHYMRSMAAIEDSPSNLFIPVMEELKKEFVAWVNSISLKDVDKKLDGINPSSLYFTFNYLETLEKIYSIPKNKVFHIHGSRLEKSFYEFGHDNFRSYEYTEGEDVLYCEEEALRSIVNTMNNYVKQYNENIRRCSEFFLKLSSIERIIVVGHSLSRIDNPYFVEIQKYISPKLHWDISCHSDADIKHIKQRCHDLQINNYELFEI